MQKIERCVERNRGRGIAVRDSLLREAPRHQGYGNDVGNPSNDGPDSQLGAEQVRGWLDRAAQSMTALEREGQVLQKNFTPYLITVASGDVCLGHVRPQTNASYRKVL